MMTLGKTKTKEEVIEALHTVAAEMHDKMLKGKPPAMTLPVRTKKNIHVRRENQRKPLTNQRKQLQNQGKPFKNQRKPL